MIAQLWRALARRRPSLELTRARERLEEVRGDDARIADLTREIARTRRENHLGPKISQALRTRRT